LQALAKIIQGKALQYAVKGKESMAHGPIVVCVDESGSMFGENIAWARGIALALLSLAHEQKRAWHYIGYSKFVNQRHRVEHGAIDMQSLCAMLNSQPSGGTNFDYVLNEAADIMASDTAFKKADIIFITDGHGKLSPDTIERINTLRARGLAVYVIGIGGELTLDILQPIASECYTVANTSLSAIDKAAEIMAKV
jgi:uncharacterized protein with von Willebrand factor type A (vWA) domain